MDKKWTRTVGGEKKPEKNEKRKPKSGGEEKAQTVRVCRRHGTEAFFDLRVSGGRPGVAAAVVATRRINEKRANNPHGTPHSGVEILGGGVQPSPVQPLSESPKTQTRVSFQ